MKIDFYHLYRHFDSSSLLPPIMLDVLSMWSRKKGWDSRIRIAREKDIAFHTDADVVAFSVYTMTAPMAYRASEKLRANGKIVVMGGPHFRNQNYREALGKCNAVASSISEEQWLALLTDIEAGNIEPGGSRTRSIIDSNHDFRYPDGLYESSSFHRWHHVPCVPTTVGCPYGCDYCGPLMSR